MVAASGDYAVGQITGAAALASPALTGTPTAPTQATADNTTAIATDAFVKAQGYATGTALVSGNYAKASGTGAFADAGVAAGPYAMPWLTFPTGSGTQGFSGTANKASVWGVVLNFPLTTTQVTYSVTTADNTASTYDIGVYNNAGTLVSHLGATAGTTFAPSTGVRTINWASGATLQPGRYYLAITSSCLASCAVVASASANAVTFLSNATVSVTTGGTLPASIAPPADAWSYGSSVPTWAVR